MPVTCTASNLATLSECFCGLTPAQRDFVEIYLLCQIANGGASGLALQQVYQDRDPAAPDDPTKPAISFPAGGGTLTLWDVGSQTWV